MRIINIFWLGWSLLSATIHAASSHVGRDEARASGAPNPFIPGAYLVELDDDQDANVFLDDLKSRGFGVEKRMRLNYRLFNGISFRVLDATEPDPISMERLNSNLGVKNIWPLHEIPVPKTEVLSSSLRKPDTGRLKTRDEELNYSPHVMTQIDKLHKAGYTGKGIRVGIIDTGIDYTHPALGGCFGEGCLIAYGRDMVGDEYSWDYPPVEDGDPMDSECPGSYGHGTHIAGIVAAQPNEHGFVGAAPGVTLGFYKVCGGVPYLPADLIIASMNRAVEDGSDIITMSLGLAFNMANDPTALVANRIVEDGTVVVSAASNAGSFTSFWSVTSPCVGGLVTCVTSVVPERIPLFLLDGSFTIDDGPEQRYGRIQLNNPSIEFAENITLPLWDVELELGSENDACGPLPDDTPDLSDRLVLIGIGDPYQARDTSCLPAAIIPNLVEKGAQYIMFYPRKVGDSRPVLLQSTPENVSVGLVATHHAATWREALAQGKTVNVSIIEAQSAAERLEFVPNDDNGGSIAAVASWGPGGDMKVNPQISAPGDFILSTFPPSAGGYSIIGGTSMATPLVAGLYALLMEARQTKDPVELLSILSSTAKSLDWFDNDSVHDFPAPVSQQGTGIVQGEKALGVVTILDPAAFSFNDTVSFEGQHEITITNNGDEEVTYQLSHVDGPAAYALTDKDGISESSVSVKPFKAAASVKLDPDTVTLAPGKSAKVKIQGSPPCKVDKARLPVYGGWIQLEGSNDQTLSVPYVGLAASLGGTPVLLPGREGGTWFETYLNGTDLEEDATYIVPRPVKGKRAEWYTTPRAGDPSYHVRPRAPAQVLRVDIVALDDVDLPIEEHLGYRVVGSTVDILGPFPVRHPVRAPFTSRFTGLLWSAKVVPEGRYQIVVSALGIYGEEDKDEDWDVVESVPFKLQYLDEEE